jgi:predicted small secreted protein
MVSLRVLLTLLPVASLVLAGCNAAGRDAKVYQAGEKALVGRITYSVVDSQTVPKLDDGNGEPRIPQNRFYIVQVSMFNSGNESFSAPTMVLVDDAGKQYPELADGRGVPEWIGVSRKVNPAETIQGMILFDAPVGHYKLRVSEDFAEIPTYVDMPVNFVHERDELLPESKKSESGIIDLRPSQSVK